MQTMKKAGNSVRSWHTAKRTWMGPLDAGALHEQVRAAEMCCGNLGVGSIGRAK